MKINAKFRLQSSSDWSAAGILFYALDSKRFLFQLRSKSSDDPLTWACFGGTTEDLESPKETAIREVYEETGFDSKVKLFALPDCKLKPNFTFYNFLGIIDTEFKPITDHETASYKWVEFGDWPKPLHKGMQWLLDTHASQIEDIINECC